MGIVELIALATQFIPVVNIGVDLVQTMGGSVPPDWWVWILKFAETVIFLQWLTPYMEKITRETANTWDDNLVAKAKMILAFAMELIVAAGAFDPQLGKRLAAITGKRKSYLPSQDTIK